MYYSINLYGCVMIDYSVMINRLTQRKQKEIISA